MGILQLSASSWSDIGIPEEPDTVAVTLNKGTNHLMLKVTDDVWSWGAIVRLEPVNVANPEPQE